MKKNTYGVAAILIRRKKGKEVLYAPIFFAGSAGGVPQFYLSSRRTANQGTAIKRAKALNAGRRP